MLTSRSDFEYVSVDPRLLAGGRAGGDGSLDSPWPVRDGTESGYPLAGLSGVKVSAKGSRRPSSLDVLWLEEAARARDAVVGGNSEKLTLNAALRSARRHVIVPQMSVLRRIARYAYRWGSSGADTIAGWLKEEAFDDSVLRIDLVSLSGDLDQDDVAFDSVVGRLNSVGYGERPSFSFIRSVFPSSSAVKEKMDAKARAEEDPIAAFMSKYGVKEYLGVSSLLGLAWQDGGYVYDPDAAGLLARPELDPKPAAALHSDMESCVVAVVPVDVATRTYTTSGGHVRTEPIGEFRAKYRTGDHSLSENGCLGTAPGGTYHCQLGPVRAYSSGDRDYDDFVELPVSYSVSYDLSAGDDGVSGTVRRDESSNPVRIPVVKIPREAGDVPGAAAGQGWRGAWTELTPEHFGVNAIPRWDGTWGSVASFAADGSSRLESALASQVAVDVRLEAKRGVLYTYLASARAQATFTDVPAGDISDPLTGGSYSAYCSQDGSETAEYKVYEQPSCVDVLSGPVYEHRRRVSGLGLIPRTPFPREVEVVGAKAMTLVASMELEIASGSADSCRYVPKAEVGTEVSDYHPCVDADEFDEDGNGPKGYSRSTSSLGMWGSPSSTVNVLSYHTPSSVVKESVGVKSKYSVALRVEPVDLTYEDGRFYLTVSDPPDVPAVAPIELDPEGVGDPPPAIELGEPPEIPPQREDYERHVLGKEKVKARLTANATLALGPVLVKLKFRNTGLKEGTEA